MPKKKLKNITTEYGIPFEEGLELVFNNLEEDMVTGKGGNTWINEDGQRVLEELIPMPVIYRGKVVSLPPNPAFLTVYIKEITQKIQARIPMREKQSKFAHKIVYVESHTEGNKVKYKWIPTPKRG
jgi:hypothetical protein